MQLERETLVEIGISLVAVSLFVATVMYIGTAYGGEELTTAGATLLVGAVFGFVILMTLVGIFLDRQ